MDSAARVLDRAVVSSGQEAKRPGDATNVPGRDTEEVTSMPDKRNANPWEQVTYAQVVSRDKPWHITGGPGFAKDPLHVTVCGERGSVVNTAYGELPRFAKLCERCAAIQAEIESAS